MRPLQGHAYHAKTDAELNFIARDARDAYAAISTFDGQAAGKYADQMNDALTVLHYRAKKAEGRKRAVAQFRRIARAPMF